ncbi:transcriptional regulator, AraC family with amidase-like domain [Roseivivax lentus]|uniref:Transcriptional regulator, AraC family with amidase-like domain n=1 Tax=Roseivivax lentus TaxID=633194 RepID=A0A1N7LQT8_9RHOB|nr:GlxA family transcriptional regulator [Roseivivax lentus]SIS76129.1 transcriptional regulator, AraC family with amidase-like domain [Roseivivax lentus]
MQTTDSKLRPPSRPPTRRLRVGFLLADRFTLSAFANFVDVLRLAADDADRSRPILCDWAVLSQDMAPVRSSCAVKVQPDMRLRAAPRFDYIAVVGGLMGEGRALDPKAVDFLRAQAAAGVPLIGLCTGVFILHEAGLLDGYRACVNWFHYDEFVARFAGAQPVSDQIFVVDRDRLTCSGGQSTAHLAAHLVERHVGHSAATKSLSIMIIDEAKSGERPQPGLPSRREASDPVVRRALLRMQQHLETPETVPEIAAALEIGRRSLERRFRQDLGVSPSRAGLEMRLDHARGLLRRTGASVTDIALASGFCDAPHLIRAFKAEWGATPAEFRSKSID